MLVAIVTFFTIFLTFILYFLFLRKKTKQRNIAFIGNRCTGKTTTIYKICRNEVVKTVPTIFSHKMKYGDLVIEDKVINKSDDKFVRYGVDDPNTLYFYFVRNQQDIEDFGRFNVKFVCFGNEWDCVEKNCDVLFLNFEPLNLVKAI